MSEEYNQDNHTENVNKSNESNIGNEDFSGKGGLGYYDPRLFAQGNTAGGAAYNVPPAQGNHSIVQPPIKKKKGFKIFLTILAVFLVLIMLFLLLVPKDSSNNAKYTPVSGNHIAIIDIIGTIELGTSSTSYTTSSYNQTWLLNTIDGLMHNSANQGILLYLNTPGGSVYATDEVYLKLLEYKEYTGRPVYAAMGPTAASGGYYMAMAADKIFANRNTMTGSIGVTMGTFYDVSELLDTLGIKTNTMTSGRNKAMGSSVEPMTDEQKAIIQSIIDESYSQFLDVVSESRGIDRETLIPIADGRAYTALQALQNGLIDEIGTLEQAVEAMKAENDLYATDTVEYYYTAELPFWMKLLNNFSNMNKGDSAEGQLAIALELMEKNQVEPFYLMQ